MSDNIAKIHRKRDAKLRIIMEDWSVSELEECISLSFWRKEDLINHILDNGFLDDEADDIIAEYEKNHTFKSEPDLNQLDIFKREE